jgi:hypothetical protein
MQLLLLKFKIKQLFLQSMFRDFLNGGEQPLRLAKSLTQF